MRLEERYAIKKNTPRCTYRIWVNNSVQICSTERAVVFDAFYVCLVRPLEYTIAGDMVSLLLDVLLDASQNISVVDACRLQQRREVVHIKVPIRTAMALTAPRWMLGEDLLTRVGRISSSTPCGITTDVTIGMSNVVPVFFVERVVCDELESLPPEDEAIF